MTYGINNQAIDDFQLKINGSEHAEDNAMRKLRLKKRSRKLIKIDILVIRVNNYDQFCISKPCIHCCKKMALLPTRGYKINKIYYTNNEGEIVSERMSSLMKTASASSFHRCKSI